MTLNGMSLRLRNVQKRFGALDVLTGINLELAPGECVAIVGRSGCGKSTLLRLIAGLDSPTAGTLLADDSVDPAARSAIRVMFQDSRLLPWKRVRDNVALGLKQNAAGRAEWALRQVGLLDRAGEWPSVLSGGQRQRVALARALASRPRMLLLDEPLGALDALTRLEMEQLIEQVWQEQGFSMLLVTHNVDEAVALADRVVVIEEGQIVFDYPIRLPRPRDRAHPDFISAREYLLSVILHAPQRALMIAS